VLYSDSLFIWLQLFGLTALFLAVPYLYEVVKWGGAAYLLWLAWNAVKPGAASILEPYKLPIESPKKLFIMGFMTNLLNPKIAILYVSLLPQFEDP
jgi:threonine/homoserine/homoserine lactone efflux protein